MIRRLGLRLGHLYHWALAAGAFDDIWDLCCDHGKLGLHLHQTQREQASAHRSRVHLVDQALQSIASLKAKYSSLLDDYLSIALMDAADIPLSGSGRQLVVVAGVGGGTITSILSGLSRQLEAAPRAGSLANIEFLLSPNLNAFELRCFLRQKGFELLNEEFVTEKGWSHEHIHVRYRNCGSDYRRVSMVGSDLWRPMTQERNGYIKKQLEHYRKRAQLSGDTDAQHAVDAYSEALQISSK